MTTLTKETRQKIRSLEKQKQQLENRIKDIEQTIEDVQAGESPIKPGMRIQWESGRGDNTRVKRGQVVSVETCGYRHSMFSYRVFILDKRNRIVGHAIVNEDHHPEILREEKKRNGSDRKVRKRPKSSSRRRL